MTCCFGKALHRTPRLTGKLLELVFRNGENVIRTLSQSRDLERDNIETIKEIFAKSATRHSFLQIAIRGGNDAHIGHSDLRFPNALIFAKISFIVSMLS